MSTKKFLNTGERKTFLANTKNNTKNRTFAVKFELAGPFRLIFGVFLHPQQRRMRNDLSALGQLQNNKQTCPWGRGKDLQEGRLEKRCWLKKVPSSVRQSKVKDRGQQVIDQHNQCGLAKKSKTQIRFDEIFCSIL